MEHTAAQDGGSAGSLSPSSLSPADGGDRTKAANPGPDSPFAFSLSLAATAFTQSQLIDPAAPQAALVGRSNVGKSSLINALARRKSLAKISAAPGKTRSINYYRLESTRGYLVDLPGYGYARCSQGERDKWARLASWYFCNTPGLRTLFLLLDARLPPQKSDKELVLFASTLSLPLLPVLTKADKCSGRELRNCADAWKKFLGQKDIPATSALEKTGISALRECIRRALAEEPASAYT
jgi:GTP-binding protein